MYLIIQVYLFSRINNSDQSKDIIYYIQVKSDKGRLVIRKNQQVISVVFFIQNDVNDGKIYYQYESFMQIVEDSDKFVFEVNTVYVNIVKN